MLNGLIGAIVFCVILTWAIPNIDGMSFNTYAGKYGYKSAVTRIWEGPSAQTTTTIKKGTTNE